MDMPGCTLFRNCKTNDPFCRPFSILGDLCSDMPKMKGCQTYTKLCASGSVVPQCQSEPPLMTFPKTSQARKLVQDICKEMDMPGCQECTRSCDYMETYIDLCQQMPKMSQCQLYDSMCVWEPNLWFCETFSAPQMKMFFHTGFRDYILFESWLPNSFGSYLLGLCFCFALGFGYETLIMYTHEFEQATTGDVSVVEDPGNDDFRPLLLSHAARIRGWSPLKLRLAKAGLRFVNITMAYLCMLLVMSFNLGLFLSTVLGIAVGTFFWTNSPSKKEHCC
ncbi:Ctr copper transporter family-domain-containing protein [Gorgonomyces haynaldii]|nr:Ctr copper transporter family-domain-containing protein [Gorgonomyces haynaldii]